MSYTKNDQVFPAKNSKYFEHEVTQSVSQVLRKNYAEINSAIKIIGRKTGANPRAIRNWYEGRNAPNSSHLIILARHIPDIARLILTLSARQDIWTSYQMIATHGAAHAQPLSAEAIESIYTDKYVSINVTVSLANTKDLNQRQLWFLGKLQQGDRLKAGDIAEIWKVGARTASRDTALLKRLDLISFVGSRKTGWYVINSNA